VKIKETKNGGGLLNSKQLARQ